MERWFHIQCFNFLSTLLLRMHIEQLPDNSFYQKITTLEQVTRNSLQEQGKFVTATLFCVLLLGSEHN